MKQAQRNDALAAILLRHRNLALDGTAWISTQRRGESVTVAVGIDRPDGTHPSILAKNLKGGWKIVRNGTGYTGDPLEIINSLLNEVA